MGKFFFHSIQFHRMRNHPIHQRIAQEALVHLGWDHSRRSIICHVHSRDHHRKMYRRKPNLHLKELKSIHI